MTKQEAIQELLSYDHCVISKECADAICEPFGTTGMIERHHKDAHRKDGNPVIGIAAHELAEHLCRRLNIDYVKQFGKGSQLRVCCKALTKSLT